MVRTFSQEIIRLEEELEAIKSAYIKTAAAVKTKTTNFGRTFALNQSDGSSAWCQQRLTVTVTTVDGSSQLCELYHNGHGSYTMNKRQIVTEKRKVGSATTFQVNVNSLLASDIQTIMNGGSVSLSYDFTIIGSSDYNFSTSWELVP